MRKQFLGLLAVAAAGALALSGCGGGSSAGGGGGSTTAGGKVGVILPDAQTSPRWENNDRPSLKKAFDGAGVQSDIQNANGDKAKFGTICDSMIAEGVKVLMIVNLDNETGSACLKKAQGAGIQTIDYDRLTLGGGAKYYVSFDNVKVGSLMGEGLTKCLTDDKKTTANVVYINGDPTDNNAALFKSGYAGFLKLTKVGQTSTVGGVTYKLVGDQTGLWNAEKAGTAFDQMYTAAGGKIDAIVSANDTMAGGIIARLKTNKLNGKVPVTGQDASDEGLQAILSGDQCMTVFKNTDLEAKAASDLAIALLKNPSSADSIATGEVEDTVLKVKVKSALATPEAIYKSNIKDVFDAGYTTPAKVCTGSYAALCQQAGIQ
jgi:D-xylose transport system substrate-binding protein